MGRIKAYMNEPAIIQMIEESRRKRVAFPDLNHTALLVVDVQEHFREMASHIIFPLGAIISEFRHRGLPVLYTQHMHRTQKDGMLSQWWGCLIRREGSREADFLSEVSPKPGETVIRKNRYSAFYHTKLESCLNSFGIEDLIICGVMTNLCCETTARDAFMRDYKVFFLADGTATADLDLHLATLKNLAFGFAYLLTCEEMLNLLGGETGNVGEI